MMHRHVVHVHIICVFNFNTTDIKQLFALTDTLVFRLTFHLLWVNFRVVKNINFDHGCLVAVFHVK